MDTTESTNEALVQIAQEYLKEQRRKRRWRNFFKLSFLILFAIFVFTVLSEQRAAKPTASAHTSLIDIEGTIFGKARASADNIAKGLRRAYQDKNTKGIILRINSPGGSPVQAAYVFDEITRLKKAHPKIKVYAVCVDLCASAAYYIAAAADEIYANPSSMVGSIGVLYNGFGFVGVMQKLGVERRLVTAGTNKGFMDPFSPVNTEQENKLRTMLAQVHTQFENSVMQGRGNRLKKTNEIFSGLIWTGIEAKNLGLIDHFGSAGFVAREVLQTKHIVDYTVKRNYLERLAERFGSSFSQEMMKTMGVGHPLQAIAR